VRDTDAKKTRTDRKRTDPRSTGPKPHFPQKKIQHPGRIDKMNPRPDHGEESYLGTGRDLPENEGEGNEAWAWIEQAGRKALMLAGDLFDE
jgi:hypothetical protein